MILHCMGTLALANITGIMPFVKPTLITILPTLGTIKLDHIKQAYAFGKFSVAHLIATIISLYPIRLQQLVILPKP